MDGAEMFGHGMRQGTVVVKQLRPEQLANATPDSEWNVRDLVSHMYYELCWVPDLVEGATLDEVGNKYEGDILSEAALGIITQWEAAADKAELAVSEADPDETAHVSYGDVAIDEYLWQVGTDLLIHAWDLAEAIGMPIKFSPPVAQEAYRYARNHTADMAASGLFGTPLEVPEAADVQTKLLALYGRGGDWRRL